MTKTYKIRNPYAKELSDPKYRSKTEDTIKIKKRKHEEQEAKQEIREYWFPNR